MTDITVHVLNFYSLASHIEIVLEDESTDPHEYLRLNRWSKPERCYFNELNKPMWIENHEQLVKQADAQFSFTLKGVDKLNITREWDQYFKESQSNAYILGDNCAVAAQWFLKNYAGVPDPNNSNISFNHLAFGVVWPSFIPCPVTLPGRVMSNIKFHLKQGVNPETTFGYVKLFKVIVSAILTIVLLPATLLFVICLLAAKLLGHTLSTLMTTLGPADDESRSSIEP